ncbi:MAG: alpha-ketoglutarate-dependent dioxygenase AlkB family protein [Bacteroidota bacterium]
MEFLFPDTSPVELLPHDGRAVYFGTVFAAETSDRLFSELEKSIPWRNDVIKMFGKEIVTTRKVAWFGDRPFEYAYSGHTHHALPWTAALIEIKEKAEEKCLTDFNACLLNLYHHGNEGMGWHSDDEVELDPVAPIASVSLGAARKFSFKHKEVKTGVSLQLNHGSLLMMDAKSQQHWLHSLPKSRKTLMARINLTFRRMR